ncbi:MAG: glycosyltransferase family 4 protein [Anaerolineae bacterium]|nr:glycosyltransferase family 4 protein [Anaerolineae bacterium]
MSESESIKGKVCLWPHLSGVGGPTSFYLKMQDGLKKRGISLAQHPLEEGCEVVLLIGGSSRVVDLWRARQRGVRIVQRLNGMNWVHRLRFTGVRHYLNSERNNMLLAGIRRHLAHAIVYQSRFSQTWWNRMYQSTSAKENVVYNGVDTTAFVPGDIYQIPDEKVQLLVVEGHLGGGHEYGLAIAHQLGAGIQRLSGRLVEVKIVGDVPKAQQVFWSRAMDVDMRFMGVVPRKDILGIDQSSHLMYTAELNAACPNAVIEAMACGLPVVGFDTGSIAELLGDEAGRAVPYGSDHWKLEAPDTAALTKAAMEILAHLPQYRQAARQRAERLFSAEEMVDSYIKALLA